MARAFQLEFGKETFEVPLEFSVDDLLGHWAWEYLAHVETMDYDDKSDVIYKDTMEEVALGFCEGAWDSASGTPRGLTAEEVSAHLGTNEWLPLKRFGVIQKNKVRGCDDAAANETQVRRGHLRVVPEVAHTDFTPTTADHDEAHPV